MAHARLVLKVVHVLDSNHLVGILQNYFWATFPQFLVEISLGTGTILEIARCTKRDIATP
jgi:hypothetical protein